MADKSDNETTCRKDNIISFRAKAGRKEGPFFVYDAEAFCIKTKEIYYISIIYQNPDGNYRCHGYASFNNGEKVKFTIANCNDEKLREKCILGGRNIAKQYGGILMAGKIDEFGQFHRSMGHQNKMLGGI